MNKIINYVKIDSEKRQKTSSIIYDTKYDLMPMAIEFTHGSSVIKIMLEKHNLNIEDHIHLFNVVSKNVTLKNVLSVKKNSMFIKITHENHELSLKGYYDPFNNNDFEKVEYIDDIPLSYGEFHVIPDGFQEFYVLKKNYDIDLSLQISNFKDDNMFIGNIPINYINKKHKIFLLFSKIDGMYILNKNRYAIKLERKSTVNYQSTQSINIKFNNLFGIPLEILNSISEPMKIKTIKPNYITINIKIPAIVDSETEIAKAGGSIMYLKKIKQIIEGYPSPNNFKIALDKEYKNITQVKIVNSIFPNINTIISKSNNKLYWRNLDDGPWIYQSSINPGNYSVDQLAKILNQTLNNTIKYQYSKEYITQKEPTIIENNNPIDFQKYDNNGYNKYNLFDVSISPETNIVSFKSYNEILQSDLDNINDGIVINAPNNYLEFTMAENLKIDFGFKGTSIVNSIVYPFKPQFEILYIYFTKNSHMRITEPNLKYSYGNLYKYLVNLDSSDIQPGYNKFNAVIELNVAILVNFFRDKWIYPMIQTFREVNSINTSTKLFNFEYNYISNRVTLANHNLKIGDLIITDQFIDISSINKLYIYEINNIVDINTFTVKKILHGDDYKFVYDSIIINFSDVPYWLDQITLNTEITPINGFPLNNNTLSFVNIVPKIQYNHISNIHVIKIKHPNHGLNKGTTIQISLSNAVNYIPANIINDYHTINRIVDDNHYEVILGKFTPLNCITFYQNNLVSIRYPNLFQLFFNFSDTLGNILGFNNVGKDNSITEYNYEISNKNSQRKVNINTNDYFYVVCPQLHILKNTKPVNNVFSEIQIRGHENKLFNTFVSLVSYKHIPKLTELDFSIVDKNGNLIDLQNHDFSMILEITENFKQS